MMSAKTAAPDFCVVLTSLFQDEFETLLEVSLLAGAVVLVVVAIQRWLGRSWSPRLMTMLWLLILVRFVLFEVPESPTSLLNFVGSSSETAVHSIPRQTFLSEISGHPTPVFQTTYQVESVSAAADTTAAYRSNFNGWVVAKLLWIAGVFAAMLVLCVRFSRVWQFIKTSSPSTADLKQLLQRAAKKVGVRSTVELRLTDELSAPAVAGFFYPKILMPKWCAIELKPREIEFVLAHELLHLRRRDNILQLFAYLVQTIHWFNPCVRIVNRRIEKYRELMCDRQVVELYSTNECRGSVSRRYGETILKVAEKYSDRRAIAPVVMDGFIGNESDLIRQRIEMLVQNRSHSKTQHFFAFACIATLIAVGYTSAQTQNPSTPPGQVTPPSNSRQIPVGAAVQDLPSIEPPNVSFEELTEPVSVLGNMAYGVVVGKSRVLEFTERIPEIMVADPNIVKVTPVSPNKLKCTGIEPGVTVVTVYDPDRNLTLFSVYAVDEPTGGNLAKRTAKAIRSMAFQAAKVAADAIVLRPKPGDRFQMAVGQSRRLQFQFRIPQVIISHPGVLKATPVGPTEIIVQARQPGQNCQLTVSRENGTTMTLNFDVTPNLASLKIELLKVFPNLDISVRNEEGAVVLSGVVNNQAQMGTIMHLASLHSSRLQNQMELLKLSEQVAFDIQLFEVLSTKQERPGDKSAGSGESSSRPGIRQILKSEGAHNPFVVTESDQVTSLMDELKNLKDQHAAQVLTSPKLITSKNHSGEFFSGVEMPIPSADGEIELRRIGTILNLAPREISDNGLVVNLSAEISKIDHELAATTGGPGFRTRRINTGVNVNFGQTFAVCWNSSSDPSGVKPDQPIAKEHYVLLVKPLKIDGSVVEPPNEKQQPPLR